MSNYPGATDFFLLVDDIAREAGLSSDEARNLVTPHLQVACRAVANGVTARVEFLGTFFPKPDGVIGFAPDPSDPTNDPGSFEIVRVPGIFVDVVFARTARKLLRGHEIEINGFGVLTPSGEGHAIFTPALFNFGGFSPDGFQGSNGIALPADGDTCAAPHSGDEQAYAESDPDENTNDPGAQMRADDQ